MFTYLTVHEEFDYREDGLVGRNRVGKYAVWKITLALRATKITETRPPVGSSVSNCSVD